MIRRLLAAVVFLVGAGWPLAGAAALISLDSIFGPDSVTRDSATDFEWLDLTETAGLSFLEVGALLAGDARFSGFRYATISELDTLMADAGIPIRGVTWNYGEGAQAALDLIELLNEKSTIPTTGRQMQGLLGEKAFAWQSEDVRAVGFVLWISGPIPGPIVTEFPAAQASPGGDAMSMWTWESRETVGSFLVRESAFAVPEPGSFFLAATALLALLGFGRSTSKRIALIGVTHGAPRVHSRHAGTDRTGRARRPGSRR